MVRQSKYAKLTNHLLERQHEEKIQMRFSEIEDLIDAKLPKSAYYSRGWWTHETNAKAWQHAQFSVAELDVKAEKVSFANLRLASPETSAAIRAFFLKDGARKYGNRRAHSPNGD